jgi:uncharacterized protein YegL
MELPKPSRADLEKWFSLFEKKNSYNGFTFGLAASTLAKKLLGRSYAEAEEFGLSVYRRFILRLPDGRPKDITRKELSLLPPIKDQIEFRSQEGDVE